MFQFTSQALKKAITLQPSNHKLWNSLGVVTASKGNVASIMVHYTYQGFLGQSIVFNHLNFFVAEVSNPDLAQHSFIMSIKTEPNVSVQISFFFMMQLRTGSSSRTFAVSAV